MPTSAALSGQSTIDEAEAAKFAAMAEEWWNPDGKFAPLHRFNPVRLGFLRDRICERFGRDPMGDRPLSGLTVADIGCGGGLLSEPMARLGATVTGIDAVEKTVGIARAHAEMSGADVTYRVGSVEEMAATGETYDVVLNMEIVEHVADLGAFVAGSSRLVKPGGMMVFATLNRTIKSFALAIVGAEYVLRWLPRGTHDWNKFVRPSELAAELRRTGMQVSEMTGVAYNPLTAKWSLAPKDLDVNYMLVAIPDE